MSTVKILIVEDLTTDAELAKREIGKELDACEYKVVETEPEYRTALDMFGPDLIISDYMLPRFDGMKALKIAADKCPETPFVVVTGSMNEDTAVACMKAGAWDYVIKEHIKRLGPAVTAALAEKETKLEKLRTEEALYRSGKEWRATFDAMNDMVFVTDTKGIILRANTAFRNFTGRPWPDIIGEQCHGLLWENPEGEGACPLARSVKSKKREETEVTLQGKWYRSTADPIFDNNGEIMEVIHILTDISSSKRMEETLRSSEAKLKAIFDGTPIIMMVVDGENRIREMNAAGKKMARNKEKDTIRLRTGPVLRCIHSLENPEGCGYSESCSGCTLRTTVLDTLETGKEHHNVEADLVLAGEERTEEKTFLIQTTPVTIEGEELVLTMLDDITELSRAREAVTEQQRLRALGQIASGIAHDINNTLAPVTLYADALFETEREISEKGKRYLRTIITSVGDIERVTSRLRTFYKTDNEERENETITLEELFEDVEEMTRPRWKDMPNKEGVRIRLEKQVSPDSPSVTGNRSELREALINLVFNAVDAMPEGGTVTLKGSTLQGRTAIVVTDTGKGMTEEERLRSLEPFYTTKGAKGSGLGLSGVYGMIQRHGGEIEIESVLNQGTTVRLLFPRAAGIAAVQNGPRENGPDGPLRILLVDDDKRIVDVLQEMLGIDGHTVEAYTEGKKAISAFEKKLKIGRAFDIVITDLGMPDMDGIKIGEEIKELSPSTPVILLTGWGSLMEENEIPPSIDAILPKPVTMEALRKALKRTGE